MCMYDRVCVRLCGRQTNRYVEEKQRERERKTKTKSFNQTFVVAYEFYTFLFCWIYITKAGERNAFLGIIFLGFQYTAQGYISTKQNEIMFTIAIVNDT